MSNNPVGDILLQDKNLSEGLKQRIERANEKSLSAEEAIKEAYQYAINVDHLDPQQARKVLYANLKYSPRWISEFLPQEAKQIQDHTNRKQKGGSSATFSNTIQNEPKNIVIPAREEIIQEAETEQTISLKFRVDVESITKIYEVEISTDIDIVNKKAINPVGRLKDIRMKK